jgi:hypothetical protein
MSDEQETQFEVDTDNVRHFVIGSHPGGSIRKHEVKRSVNPNRDTNDFMSHASRIAQDMHNDGFTNIFLARSALIVTCRFVPPQSQGGWHQLYPNEQPQPPENDND